MTHRCPTDSSASVPWYASRPDWRPAQGTIFLAVLVAIGGMGAVASSGWAQGTEPVPMKVLRYARHVIARHDTTGDGRLSPEEWENLEGVPASADRDGDGYLTADDLAAYLAQYGARRRIRLMPATVDGAIRLPSLLHAGDWDPDSEPGLGGETPAWDEPPAEPDIPDEERGGARRFTASSGRLPSGLPRWFIERDLDGDGQVTLAEFAPTGSPAAIEQFRAYDRDGDGVITAREALLGPAPTDRRRSARRSPATEERPATARPSPEAIAPEVQDDPVEETDEDEDADEDVAEAAETQDSSETSRRRRR